MSFPRYPKYKDSGVEWLGKVPAHWQVKPLYGTVFERAESNEGMIEDNLLSLSYGRIVKKDITASDGLLPESFETYQIVRPGDIVFRLTDLQNDKRSLRSAIVEETGIITFAYLAVTPRGADSRYVSHLFRAYDASKVFYSMGGGLRQSMKFADLKRMPTLVPPLPEQTAIAEFLDRETGKIDALVAEQRRLMELLKEKRQAVISHAVTRGLNPAAPLKPSGIEWLGDIPEHWETPPLYVRYEQALGKMLDQGKMTGAHPTPYLRNQDVRWDRFNVDDLPTMDIRPEERGRFTVRRGDILMVEGRELGRCAIWDRDDDVIGFQKALHRLRPRDRTEVTRFFYYTMVFVNATGVFIANHDPNEIPHLTGEELRRYRFPRPPVEEQRHVVAFLDAELAKFDTLTAEAQRAIDLLQERRTALISAAVTGQIDVREYRSRTIP